MTRWLSLLTLSFGLVLSPLARAGDPPPLVLGVFPYVTPVQLAQFHAPLKDYLAERLKRPVTLVTAPDFMTFVERTRAGNYDLIITAPHMGRLAETRDGYQRIAQTGHTVQSLFLARKDSGIERIEDLKGRRVMIAQKVSLIYQMAEHMLRSKGLVPGETVTIIETRTHNNAMHAPLRGEADASVTGTLLFKVLEDEQKKQLKVIGSSPEMPGFMVMANRRVSAPDVAKIRGLLLDFHKMPDSAGYFATTGFAQFKLIDDKVMRTMDPYTLTLIHSPNP